MAHDTTDKDRDVLDRLIREVGEKGIVEFRPRMEGNTMHVILAPPRQVPGSKKPERQPPQPPPQQNAQSAGGKQTGT